MKKNNYTYIFFTVLFFTCIYFLTTSGLIPNVSNHPKKILLGTLYNNSKDHKLKQLPLNNTNDTLVSIIVELKGDYLSNARNKDFVYNKIMEMQNRCKDKIRNICINPHFKESYYYLLNGFSLDVYHKDITKIASLKNVKNIHFVKTHTRSVLSTSQSIKDSTNYNSLNNSYTGKGIVISIIDDGIDPTLSSLTLKDSDNIKLKKSHIKGPGKYFSDKIPYGYNFVDSNTFIDSINNHGNIIASIIGGNPKDDDSSAFRAIKGLAPNAQLLAMKIFSNTSKSTVKTDLLIKAIEASVINGADIINLSVGFGAHHYDENSPANLVIKRALEQGIVFIGACGNSSYTTYPLRISNIKDNGTVNFPSTSEAVLSVGHCKSSYNLTNKIIDHIPIFPMSSLGPTSNLKIKPELIAPGEVILYDKNNSTYTSKGSSLACAYVSSIACQFLEYLNEEPIKFFTPYEKPLFVYNNFINTASIAIDTSTNKIPYSPRRQGGGFINNAKLFKNQVILTDINNLSTINLGNFSSLNIPFKIKIKNLSESSINYTLENILPSFTEQSKNIKFESYNLPINNTTISFSKSMIKLGSREETTIDSILHLPKDLQKDVFVEGFIFLKNKEYENDILTIPYMGFYGDWNNLPIYDNTLYSNSSYLKRSGIYEILPNKTYKLLGHDTQSNVYDKDKIAISTAHNNLVGAKITFLRNCKNLVINILNSDKKIIETIVTSNSVTKSIWVEEEGFLKDKKPVTPNHMYRWDLKRINPKNKKLELVEDGQYYFDITSYPVMKDSTKQDMIIPIKVDSIAPIIHSVKKNKNSDGTYKISIKAKDGYTGISNIILSTGPTILIDEQWTNLAKQKSFFNNYSFNVSLPKENTSIDIKVIDFAGNESEYTLK